MKRILCLIAFFARSLIAIAAESFDPSGIVLTWQGDPTTTMTVDWHSIDGLDLELIEQPSPGHKLPSFVPRHARVREPVLEYRRLGSNSWATGRGKNIPFPFKEDREGSLHRDGYSHSFPPSGRTIHRVQLTGLASDTLYEVRFDPVGGVIYRFRTMPKSLSREIRIAAGGDVGAGTWTETMNRIASSYEADFVLWGGDLAYCDGAQARLGRWYEFFDSMKKSLLAADRRLIPVLVTPGNHEVQGGYIQAVEKKSGKPYNRNDDQLRQEVAPYFFSFFAMPGQPGYNILDFGDYLSVLMLDSGHVNPIDGVQAAWLEDALARRANVPHIFPSYHVPGFPTFRPLNDPPGMAVRQYWAPIFEKHRLRVVFENHDHNFKRTYSIKNGQRDADGVTYLGDGAWGTFVVGVAKEERWFLEKTMPINHFYLVRLNGRKAVFEAINLRNQVIDRFEPRPR
jgi:acid phosphatase type 7